jgi:hypothetical protein
MVQDMGASPSLQEVQQATDLLQGHAQIVITPFMEAMHLLTPHPDIIPERYL